MSRARPILRAAILVAALAPSAAAACGAFYADEVEVDPDQEIVVIQRDGLETYVFRPRFCGAAASFGVILPIPSTLVTPPTLAPAALFDDLDRYTAPSVEEVCDSGGIGCGAGSVGDGPPPPGFGTGVDVIDRGQVGMFDYALLQAASGSALTDWLTLNRFPYDPADATASAAYAHYADAGWYFVAFSVSTGASAPPPGMRLCGDLGPIQLVFASPSAVVPARITNVNTVGAPAPRWRIAAIAPAQQALAASTFLHQDYFSGTLSHGQMADYPALTAASVDGDRLTVLDVTFPGTGAAGDIVLQDWPAPYDFRSTRHVRKDCGACSAGGAPIGFAGAAAGLALLRALTRRRRRP